MKIMLLGIAVILFGIAWILGSTGGATAIGFYIAIFGLVLSIFGAAKRESK